MIALCADDAAAERVREAVAAVGRDAFIVHAGGNP
jgi:hypothetical protein